MMEDLESLTRHRRAIETTIPLLEAVRSIAEMALRAAERAATPLAAYADQVSAMLNSVSGSLDPALREKLPGTTVGSGPPAVLLVGSERGLCGAFNERLVEYATPLLGPDTLLICWGSRVTRAARSARHEVDVSVPLPSLRIASYSEVERMMLDLLDLVEQRNVQRVQVVYDAPTRGFQHALRVEQILPPPALAPQLSGTVMEVKPASDTSTLFVQLITEHLLTEVHRIVLEAAISEQLARVAAMRLASDNAHKLLDDLITHYNLASQHAITQSLLGIVTGFQTTLETAQDGARSGHHVNAAVRDRANTG